jgi:small conductance mechanosensitive channel
MVSKTLIRKMSRAEFVRSCSRPCLDYHPLSRALDQTRRTVARCIAVIVVCAAPTLVWPQAETMASGSTAFGEVPLPDENFSLQQFRSAIVGEAGAALAAQSRSALEFTVTPMRLEELKKQSEDAISYLQAAAGALSALIIDAERRIKEGSFTPELEEEFSARGRLLYELRNELAVRATILLDAAEAKGAELPEGRTYIKVVTNLDLPQSSNDPELSEDEQGALQVIRQVREEPPVHERGDPWKVPVAELVEELQPLRRTELEERVEAWLTILQREVRKRIRMDIALGKTEEQKEKEVIAALAAEQQQVVLATVERVEAVLGVLAKRGGDTTMARQYIGNATGQRINLRDPAVFYAQAKAWALSPSGGGQLAMNVGKFLLILFVVWIISRVIGRLVGAAVSRLPDASSLLRDFLVGISRRLVMLIGLLIAVSALGVNITPLAAAIGAAGLVIGLALQGTLSNFASGILILMYKPFDVGDVVNAGGVFGKVETMTLVSTRILTFDNQVNWVPNDSIWNNVITNATALQTRRVDMVFSIGYSDDMAKAQAIIEKAVSEHPKVLADPAPTIRVNELGDSSVNFIVRPWARTADYWDVYWDLMRMIKERFDEAGVNIPFPQRDLHLSGPIEVVLSDAMRAAAGAGGAQKTAAAAYEPSRGNTTKEPGPARTDEEDGDGDGRQQ